jgi:hypothetical protein
MRLGDCPAILGASRRGEKPRQTSPGRRPAALEIFALCENERKRGPGAHDLPGAVSSPRCPRAARTPPKRSTLALKDLRAERVGATLERKRRTTVCRFRRSPRAFVFPSYPSREATESALYGAGLRPRVVARLLYDNHRRSPVRGRTSADKSCGFRSMVAMRAPRDCGDPRDARCLGSRATVRAPLLARSEQVDRSRDALP